MSEALSSFRVCDFSGQLAGAGATRWLAAFGAEVVRVEDPVRKGRWDILRGAGPYLDERRGVNLGGAFNNHNVGKLGITLNFRDERSGEILERLVAVSDVVTENFANGVMERWGFGYERLKSINPRIIYVSNCGFGHTGPYRDFRSWGPIAQAISGLTFANGLPNREPAGWGYSFMDHTGAHYMTMAILMALYHRQTTGEGQWVDMACTETAVTLNGPALLDWTVNHRPMRRPGSPHANHNRWPPMAPHGIYPSAGDDEWVAIACRHQADWQALCEVVGEDWCGDVRFADEQSRYSAQDALDENLGRWTIRCGKFETEALLEGARVPVAAVQRPEERIDFDSSTSAFGLWPEVDHGEMGRVRVDGLPVHLSGTDWQMARGAPGLGEHNEQVLTELLGYTSEQVAEFTKEGVL